MDAETLILKRMRPPPKRKLDLDAVWPVHSVGAWPEGLSLSREDIYEDRL